MQRYSEMLDHLERRIAIHGLAADDPALETIAGILVRTGTLPAIAGILTDPTQPDPVRMRALARAMRALRAADHAPFVPATVGIERDRTYDKERPQRRATRSWRKRTDLHAGRRQDPAAIVPSRM